MTTLLACFLIALAASLVLTPAMKHVGLKTGIVDIPDARKMHTEPIPRIGGVAIFGAFCLTLAIAQFFHTKVSNAITFNSYNSLLALGACIAFGIGLLDDIFRIRASVKLLFQIVSASMAFLGGCAITRVDLVVIHFSTGPLAYLITLFWFILFINAINLIDGLDGLAGGVSLFASIVMVGLLSAKGRLDVAMLFATLAGSILGFLRYNFNPASIFMGDSGSYFIGYILAAFSIMGSAKTQMSTLMLIPMLSLGVPIFDTVLSPIRRFLLGRKMFQPDREHIHHKLVQVGLTTRKAVLIIYGISSVLCILGLLIVNMKNETAGLFLSVLGAVSFLFIRKLGYLEYFAMDKIYGWFRDVTDEVGITLERRSFLDIQMEIARSKTLDDMWIGIKKAFERLHIDAGELRVLMPHPQPYEALPPKWRWTRPELNGQLNILSESAMKLEMPLMTDNGVCLGTLWILKDLGQNGIQPYTLRRVEHLRRTIIRTLNGLLNARPVKTTDDVRRENAGSTVGQNY